MLAECCDFHLPHTVLFWASGEYASPFQEFQEVTSPISLLRCRPSKKPDDCPLPFLLSTRLLADNSFCQTHFFPTPPCFPSNCSSYSYSRSCRCVLPCTVWSVEYYVILWHRHFYFAPVGNARWCQRVLKEWLTSLGPEHLSISFLLCSCIWRKNLTTQDCEIL